MNHYYSTHNSFSNDTANAKLLLCRKCFKEIPMISLIQLQRDIIVEAKCKCSFTQRYSLDFYINSPWNMSYLYEEEYHCTV